MMGRLDKLEGSIEHKANNQAHEKQVKKALERVTECEGQLEAIQVQPPSVAAASCGACLLRFALALLPPAHCLLLLQDAIVSNEATAEDNQKAIESEVRLLSAAQVMSD